MSNYIFTVAISPKTSSIEITQTLIKRGPNCKVVLSFPSKASKIHSKPSENIDKIEPFPLHRTGCRKPYKTCPKLMILGSGWTARAGARRGRRLGRRHESGITVRDVNFRIITHPSFLVNSWRKSCKPNKTPRVFSFGLQDCAGNLLKTRGGGYYSEIDISDCDPGFLPAT